MQSPPPIRLDRSRLVRRTRWGRDGRRAQRAIYGAALVTALTVVCSGCIPGTSRGPPTGAQTAGRQRAVITVGAFDFPESVLLAHLYGDALKAKGFPVRVLPGLGSQIGRAHV